MTRMPATARSIVRRRESSVGPLALDGRTITLVARTTAVNVGRPWGALHVRARPVHVEVLDGEGHRQVVRVHDVEQTLVVAITLAGLVAAIGLRSIRNRRSST
jgi:hypothetical protein